MFAPDFIAWLADFRPHLVLGWYHTHPGWGLFLSAHDQFIHGNFYGGPHHVALVIDLRLPKMAGGTTRKLSNAFWPQRRKL